MKTHELKCWPRFFVPLYRGEKTFEFRKDDRGFEVGDVLDLREWEPDGATSWIGRDDILERLAPAGGYTGANIRCVVTYILRAPDAGVPDGYVVMSLQRLS
jgi:Domain of unknown function (DUF3850)